MNGSEQRAESMGHGAWGKGHGAWRTEKGEGKGVAEFRKVGRPKTGFR